MLGLNVYIICMLVHTGDVFSNVRGPTLLLNLDPYMDTHETCMDILLLLI